MLPLYLLIAINYISLMVAAVSALLISISFTRAQRARYPMLKRLDGKQMWLGAITVVALGFGYGAYTWKELLIARLSYEVSIGSDGAPTEIASSIGLAGELKHAAAVLVSDAKEDFREGERAFKDGRMADAEAAFRRSVASVPSMAGLLNLGLSQLRQGRLAEAHSTLEAGLTLALKRADLRFQSRFTRRLGDDAVLSGQLSDAQTRYVNALRIDIKTNDVAAQAAATMGLGVVEDQQDRYARAIQYFKRALQLYRAAGVSYDEPGVLVNMGATYFASGDVHNAEQTYQTAISLAEDSGNLRAGARAHSGTAAIYERRGDLGRANGSYERAAAMYSRIGDMHGETTNLIGQAAVYQHMGEYDKAVKLLTTAVQVAKRTGARKLIGNALFWLGSSATELGDVKLAEESYTQSLALAREIESPVDQADALSGLGEVLLKKGSSSDAKHRYDEALALSKASKYQMGEADALAGLADVARMHGSATEAVEILTDACPRYKQLEDVAGQARCFAKLGEAYAQAKQRDAAIDVLRKADTLYTSSGVHDSERTKSKRLFQQLTEGSTLPH